MIAAPYGAMRGAFSLRAIRREVAAYYGLDAERMARSGGGPEYQEAREALAYKLHTESACTVRRIAQLLRVAPATASAWIASHTDRIQEFRATLKAYAVAKEKGVVFQ